MVSGAGSEPSGGLHEVHGGYQMAFEKPRKVASGVSLDHFKTVSDALPKCIIWPLL